MKRFRARQFWTGFILAAFWGGAGVALGAPPPEKVNVILIALDQLRADRLHCYGNPRATSPNLDRLAARGVRATRFFTVASWTSPSYASLMTSLYPSRHGVTLFWKPGMPLIDKDTPMLAEVFQAHGYATAAFVNNGLAGEDLTGRGFDEYFEGQRAGAALNVTQRAGPGANTPYSAPATMGQLLPWINRHEQKPFFLFVLLWEPHSPYNPPREDDLFKSDAYPYASDTGYDIKTAPLKRLAMLGDQKAIERLYQLYDGKIHFVDRYVGELMDHLREIGLEENTLVVLTSDHGELMYSHPKDFLTFDHRSLYDADLNIPLIVAGPGVPEGGVFEGLASNIDTAPTILDLAGLPPLADAQGHSLVPLIQGKARAVNQFVYGEEDVAIPQRMVRSERFKLIRNLWTGADQLFDLTRDPGEQTDVAKENPQPVKELKAQLERWMHENQPSGERQRARWRIYTQPEKETIVDDETIGGRLLLTGGGWHSDERPVSANYEGACFWTEAGDGSRTAVWRGDDPFVGNYRISVYYGKPAAGKLASDATFTIVSESGEQIVRVDFNRHAGEWLPLGTFTDPRTVSLSNAADGAIIVDAVKFERVE